MSVADQETQESGRFIHGTEGNPQACFAVCGEIIG